MQLLVVVILALVACTSAAPNVVELEIEDDAKFLVDMLETKEDLIDFITESDKDDVSVFPILITRYYLAILN